MSKLTNLKKARLTVAWQDLVIYIPVLSVTLVLFLQTLVWMPVRERFFAVVDSPVDVGVFVPVVWELPEGHFHVWVWGTFGC